MTSSSSDFPEDVAVEYDPEADSPVNKADRVRRENEDELLKVPSVTGVGLGQNAIGDDAIIIYLRDKAAIANLPKQIDGIDVIFEVTGEIEAY